MSSSHTAAKRPKPLALRSSRISWGIAIAVGVVLGVTTGDYWLGLLTTAFIFAILAVSVDVLWGYTGILSLGQSAFFGIGAYGVGMMLVHVSTAWWAILAAVVGSIVVAVIAGGLVGWFSFYGRSERPAFYIAVVTLAVAVLFGQIVLLGGTATGGSNGLSGFEATEIDDRGWYWIALGALGVVVAAALIVVRSDFGLVMRAVRENSERTRYLGFHVARVELVVFMFGAGLAGLAGTLYALYSSVVAPSLVGFALATNALIWVAVGGRGTIVGPVVGAIAINLAAPSLNARFPFWWQLILGCVFVIVVVVVPRGVGPALLTIGRTLARRLPTTVRTKTQSDDRPIRISEPGSGAEDDSSRSRATLGVNALGRRFGSFEALADVTFLAAGGELVSVVGPNGAGKTTLLRAIADGRKRTSGTVSVGGRDTTHFQPEQLAQAGIGLKFQGGQVFENLTVAECLEVSAWRGEWPSWRRRAPGFTLPVASADLVRTSGLEAIQDVRPRGLSHGARQNLEIAMVLATAPSILLLDEPTAGLSVAERRAVGALLRSLTASENLCVLLIEHDFEFVKGISTRMLVLHEGKLVADGSVDEVASSTVVRAIYLGQETAELPVAAQ